MLNGFFKDIDTEFALLNTQCLLACLLGVARAASGLLSLSSRMVSNDPVACLKIPIDSGVWFESP